MKTPASVDDRLQVAADLLDVPRRPVQPVVQLPVVQQRPERAVAAVDAGHDLTASGAVISLMFSMASAIWSAGGGLFGSLDSLNFRSVRSVISMVSTIRSTAVLLVRAGAAG